MEVNKNLVKLLKLLSSDSEKANEFSNKKTREELYEYCISLIPGYSESEFTEFMKNLLMLSKNQNNTSEISEEDLEHISGGADIFETLVSILKAFQEGKSEGDRILRNLSNMNF